MKNVKVLFVMALAVFAGALSFTTSGCKSTTDPDDDNAPAQPVTADLFPLTVGHQLVFSGHLKDANDQPIAGTEAFYQARMTVISNSAPSPTGGTATALSDSQLVSPPSTWFHQTFLVQRETPEGNGNISFLTDIGLIYRNFNITDEAGNIRADSLQWVVLVNQEEGTSTDGWVAFGYDEETGEGTEGQGSWDGEVSGVTVPVQLIVRGKMTLVTDFETPGGTFDEVYYITASRHVLVNGQEVSTGTTAELWLAPDVGLVKFIFHADTETGGFERNYESRNF